MLSFSIGSTMDREDLFAEIYINNSQWAEVSIGESKKKVNIIIYFFSKLTNCYQSQLSDYNRFIEYFFKIKCLLLESLENNVELFINNFNFGRMLSVNNNIKVIIYFFSNQEGGHDEYNFDYDDFLLVIEQAKNELLRIEGITI